MLPHLLTVRALTRGQLEGLLAAAEGIDPDARGAVRPGLVVFFSERQSVRTRISTQLAAAILGMGFVDLADTFYADPTKRSDHASFERQELRALAALGTAAFVARVRSHAILESWAAAGAVPVVNACSDDEHPLHGLTDALVLKRAFGRLEGVRVTYVGNGRSPVLRSLLALAPRTGLDVRAVTPPAYEPAAALLAELGLDRGTVVSNDLSSALTGADVVYTDEWFYRFPAEEERNAFAPYRVSHALLDEICPQARMMHPLPHGEEVEEGVLERPGSLVDEQVRMRRVMTAAVLGEIAG